MSTWKNESTDLLCKALLTLRTEEECYAFLEDICTIKETADIAQRLAVAAKLDKGDTYSAVSAGTGASSTTISRVSRCLEYGAGGYRLVLDRLGTEK